VVRAAQRPLCPLSFMSIPLTAPEQRVDGTIH
jgi:hypothetical protein